MADRFSLNFGPSLSQPNENINNDKTSVELTKNERYSCVLLPSKRSRPGQQQCMTAAMAQPLERSFTSFTTGKQGLSLDSSLSFRYRSCTRQEQGDLWESRHASSCEVYGTYIELCLKWRTMNILNTISVVALGLRVNIL